MYRRLLLLGLLAQGEMHGYRLHEFLERWLAVCSDLKRPTAYFLLDKLAQEGYVSVSIAREGNYPERKVYSITPAGRDYFLTLLRENLATAERVYYPGDVGLAFLHDLPAAERLELLQVRRAGLAAALAQLESVPHREGALGLIIERNVALLRADLAWLDSALARAAAVDSLMGERTTSEP